MIDTYQSLIVNWSYPTTVRFGPGRISELANACRGAGIRAPLFVTDAGLASLPIVTDALSSLEEAGLSTVLFTDLQANPVAENIDKGVALYRAGHHDGVVAFGGGSALDTGKAIAFMSGQSRPIWDFEDREDWWTRADAAGIAPVIAVPTTAGTGSEMARASVITDERDNTKKIIFHPKMLPVEVIADPKLTIGLPAAITAATGMDALSHSLEAYCGTTWHPIGQGIALEGMRLVKEWLPEATANGGNVEARGFMLAASSMGAVAFQKGLGAMHAMSHPCSSLKGTHHGLTNAVVMPYVLLHNLREIDEKLSALARYLNIGTTATSVVDWVLALREQLEIPGTLGDLGITTDLIDQMVPMAMDDPSTGGNPVPMTRGAYEQLYEKAINGTLP